ELERIEREYPQRLKVIHTLTREPDPSAHGPNVRKGRIDAALLKELLPDPESVLVYACGPAIGPWDRLAAKEKGQEPQPRFMEAILAALESIGVPGDRVKRESYG